MRNKILSDDASRCGAVGLLVDRAHRIDIALPNGEQLLDVNRFSEGFSERGNKFIGPGETLARATGEAEQPWAAIVVWVHTAKSLAVFHPGELAVVERKPKGIAESRERSLGRVRFGGFERELMGLSWS